MSNEQLIPQIEAALKRLYDPRTSSLDRQKVESDLSLFKTSTPKSYLASLTSLTSHINDTGPSLSHHLQFFLGNVLLHFSGPKVLEGLGGEERRELERGVKNLVNNSFILHPGMLSRPTLQKILLTYVHISKASSSPQNPHFLTEIISTCSNSDPSIASLGSKLLSLIVEEFPNFEPPHTMRGHRRSEISSLLHSALPTIASCLPLTSSNPSTQRSSLNALLTILTYPTRFKITRTYNISPCITLPLVSSLLSTISTNSTNKTLALMCLNEITSQNCYPNEMAKEFIVKLASHVNQVVGEYTKILKNGGGTNVARTKPSEERSDEL
ncbi:hypothetical protein TL16_g05782 [Triparma laevis f. inornata]|uniref:Exportin-1/Importin-beta-like domain-containing protein n=1 Tax=Triparma laevis f. inornata TaxID=1714386 RepID=A0A9W7E853_9STRA|nr:hypothetical protein TL16_g05782 [Triparma laevis f. inornata]